MKSLSDYFMSLDLPPRMERKFIMSRGQSLLSLAELRALGFKRLFSARSVHSFYFDDLDFTMLRANIDGLEHRNKIRLRFYNGDMSTAVIETKHKRGFIGYKAVHGLENHSTNFENLLLISHGWIRLNFTETLFPSAFVCYQRQYYEKDGFRVTIDDGILGGRIVGSSCLNSAMLNYSVIEFKYPLELDNQFRERCFYSNFAMRNTKSSKYSNALMY